MLGGSAFAGKAMYTVGCLLAVVVLVTSGYAFKVVSLTHGVNGGANIGGGEPTADAQNILLMGLESRTDYEGNVLSGGLLAAMHAGSVDGVVNHGVGGQATNTLILLHIFAGGGRAVGFSIPRDDWVDYPEPYDGQTHGKIDQAYGLAYAQSLNESVNSGKSSQQRYLEANQAGQLAAVATVEAVTGQQINHFAEVNLAGFYYLAKAFGGIVACVKPWTGGHNQNLKDANSGWNAVLDGYDLAKGGNQYLRLSAPQALAYVRDRDSLPNGDIDRTHRQQSVIDYVIWKLKNGGILSDLGQLTSLLSTAKQYLITDANWNLLQFAPQMKALTGNNLQFYTAPIVTYQTIEGQSANVIDIPTIQADIKAKFTAPAPGSAGKGAGAKSTAKAALVPAPSTVTVDVYNGSGVGGLAGQVSTALVAKGYTAGTTGNAPDQTQTVAQGTQVFYGSGAAANADKIADYFGANATALSSLPSGHVEVLIGTGSTVLPGSLTAAEASSSSSSAAATPSSAAAPVSAGNNGAVGGAVSVAANARYGVPCVY